MKGKHQISLLSLLLIFALSGCLTVEKKEYKFEIGEDGKGTLTIKYVNIMSMQNDGDDDPENDFKELVETYIEGNEIENRFPAAQVRSKRLFEEDGILCGEAVIDFEKLSDIGIFRYKNEGPLMFHIGSFDDNEVFLNANGQYGGDQMPVVFWDEEEKALSLSTYVTEPGESTISLLDSYKNWE